MASSVDKEKPEMIVKRVSVPVGLEELMEGLTKEVMLKKPKDLYRFASDYFAKLIDLREKGILKGLKAKRAQSVTKQQLALGNVQQYRQKKSKSVEAARQVAKQNELLPETQIDERTFSTKKIQIVSKARTFLEKRKTDRTSQVSANSCKENDRKDNENIEMVKKSTITRRGRSLSNQRTTVASSKTPSRQQSTDKVGKSKTNKKESISKQGSKDGNLQLSEGKELATVKTQDNIDVTSNPEFNKMAPVIEICKKQHVNYPCPVDEEETLMKNSNEILPEGIDEPDNKDQALGDISESQEDNQLKYALKNEEKEIEIGTKNAADMKDHFISNQLTETTKSEATNTMEEPTIKEGSSLIDKRNKMEQLVEEQIISSTHANTKESEEYLTRAAAISNIKNAEEQKSDNLAETTKDVSDLTDLNASSSIKIEQNDFNLTEKINDQLGTSDTMKKAIESLNKSTEKTEETYKTSTESTLIDKKSSNKSTENKAEPRESSFKNIDEKSSNKAIEETELPKEFCSEIPVTDKSSDKSTDNKGQSKESNLENTALNIKSSVMDKSLDESTPNEALPKESKCENLVIGEKHSNKVTEKKAQPEKCTTESTSIDSKASNKSIDKPEQTDESSPINTLTDKDSSNKSVEKEPPPDFSSKISEVDKSPDKSAEKKEISSSENTVIAKETSNKSIEKREESKIFSSHDSLIRKSSDKSNEKKEPPEKCSTDRTSIDNKVSNISIEKPDKPEESSSENKAIDKKSSQKSAGNIDLPQESTNKSAEKREPSEEPSAEKSVSDKFAKKSIEKIEQSEKSSSDNTAINQSSDQSTDKKSTQSAEKTEKLNAQIASIDIKSVNKSIESNQMPEKSSSIDKIDKKSRQSSLENKEKEIPLSSRTVTADVNGTFIEHEKENGVKSEPTTENDAIEKITSAPIVDLQKCLVKQVAIDVNLSENGTPRLHETTSKSESVTEKNVTENVPKKDMENLDKTSASNTKIETNQEEANTNTQFRNDFTFDDFDMVQDLDIIGNKTKAPTRKFQNRSKTAPETKNYGVDKGLTNRNEIDKKATNTDYKEKDEIQPTPSNTDPITSSKPEKSQNGKAKTTDKSLSTKTTDESDPDKQKAVKVYTESKLDESPENQIKTVQNEHPGQSESSLKMNEVQTAEGETSTSKISNATDITSEQSKSKVKTESDSKIIEKTELAQLMCATESSEAKSVSESKTDPTPSNKAPQPKPKTVSVTTKLVAPEESLSTENKKDSDADFKFVEQQDTDKTEKTPAKEPASHSDTAIGKSVDPVSTVGLINTVNPTATGVESEATTTINSKNTAESQATIRPETIKLNSLESKADAVSVVLEVKNPAINPATKPSQSSAKSSASKNDTEMASEAPHQVREPMDSFKSSFSSELPATKKPTDLKESNDNKKMENSDHHFDEALKKAGPDSSESEPIAVATTESKETNIKPQLNTPEIVAKTSEAKVELKAPPTCRESKTSMPSSSEISVASNNSTDLKNIPDNKETENPDHHSKSETLKQSASDSVESKPKVLVTTESKETIVPQSNKAELMSKSPETKDEFRKSKQTIELKNENTLLESKDGTSSGPGNTEAYEKPVTNVPEETRGKSDETKIGGEMFTPNDHTENPSITKLDSSKSAKNDKADIEKTIKKDSPVISNAISTIEKSRTSSSEKSQDTEDVKKNHMLDSIKEGSIKELPKKIIQAVAPRVIGSSKAKSEDSSKVKPIKSRKPIRIKSMEHIKKEWSESQKTSVPKEDNKDVRRTKRAISMDNKFSSKPANSALSQRSFDSSKTKKPTGGPGDPEIKTGDLEREKCTKAPLNAVSAAIKIQSLWRGFRIRKNAQFAAKTAVIAGTCIEPVNNDSVIISVRPEIKSNGHREENTDTPKVITDISENIVDADGIPGDRAGVKIAEAAAKIQAIWKGFRIRERKKRGELFGPGIEHQAKSEREQIIEPREKLDGRHSAATKIQSIWRGFKVRENIAAVQNKLQTIDNGGEKAVQLSPETIFKAASIIQAGVRGYIVRKNKPATNLKSINEETPNDIEIISSICNLEEIPRDSPESKMVRSNTDSAIEDKTIKIERQFSLDENSKNLPMEKLKHNSLERQTDESKLTLLEREVKDAIRLFSENNNSEEIEDKNLNVAKIENENNISPANVIADENKLEVPNESECNEKLSKDDEKIEGITSTDSSTSFDSVDTVIFTGNSVTNINGSGEKHDSENPDLDENQKLKNLSNKQDPKTSIIENTLIHSKEADDIETKSIENDINQPMTIIEAEKNNAGSTRTAEESKPTEKKDDKNNKIQILEVEDNNKPETASTIDILKLNKSALEKEIESKEINLKHFMKSKSENELKNKLILDTANETNTKILTKSLTQERKVESDSITMSTVENQINEYAQKFDKTQDNVAGTETEKSDNESELVSSSKNANEKESQEIISGDDTKLQTSGSKSSETGDQTLVLDQNGQINIPKLKREIRSHNKVDENWIKMEEIIPKNSTATDATVETKKEIAASEEKVVHRDHSLTSDQNGEINIPELKREIRSHNNVDENWIRQEEILPKIDKTTDTTVETNEEVRTTQGKLLHTSELHDTISVTVSEDSSTQCEAPEALSHTGELHDLVLPALVQVQEETPGQVFVIIVSGKH